jgi:hypothetical protein
MSNSFTRTCQDQISHRIVRWCEVALDVTNCTFARLVTSSQSLALRSVGRVEEARGPQLWIKPDLALTAGCLWVSRPFVRMNYC